MEKIDVFRFLLYQLMDKNQQLKEDITLHHKRMEVDIHGGKCSCSFSNNVNIGIKDIQNIYEQNENLSSLLSDSASFRNDYKENLDLCSSDIYNILGINISSAFSPEPVELLDGSSYLSHEKLSPVDISTTFSILYVIFHEIGHTINNNQYNCELDKEYAADEFAFGILKSYVSVLGKDYKASIIVGGVCAILNMLFNRSSEEEEADTDHPYSIERLYLLLKSFDIDESSIIWEKVYNKITGWLLNNHMDEQVNTIQSSLYKAKIEELYIMFNRRNG